MKEFLMLLDKHGFNLEVTRRPVQHYTPELGFRAILRYEGVGAFSNRDSEVLFSDPTGGVVKRTGFGASWTEAVRDLAVNIKGMTTSHPVDGDGLCVMQITFDGYEVPEAV